MILWLFVTLTSLVCVYVWITRKLSYWKKRGVTQFTSESYLEQLQIISNRSPTEKLGDLYLKSPDVRYVGVYHTIMPMLLIKDPELMKTITVKEIDTFLDHRQFAPEDVDPLWGKNLFAATAFGLKCDSLKYQDDEFYLTGRAATDFGFTTPLKFMANYLSPFIARLFKFRLFSIEICQYFTSIIEETLRAREEKNIVRPDLIHLLMEIRKGKIRASNGKEDSTSTTETYLRESKQMEEMDLTLEDIVAQAFIFFLAGFDTVSTSISFMAYELVVNPEIQEKLRTEVDEVFERCGGNVTYEAILGMKYMDMVVSEVLRKWPPMPLTDRVATRSFTIEPELPGEKAFTLEKGDVCMLSIFGMHRHPKFYPNPETFDPERFSEENKKNINNYTYIPFGVGPRNCIGSRFALIEVKLIIFNILKHFSIVPTEKTRIPVKLDRRKHTLTAEGGIYLGLKRRNAL